MDGIEWENRIYKQFASEAVQKWHLPNLNHKDEVLGVNAQDNKLIWVIEKCEQCSERDKKIAKIILDKRLLELSELG